MHIYDLQANFIFDRVKTLKILLIHWKKLYSSFSIFENHTKTDTTFFALNAVIGLLRFKSPLNVSKNIDDCMQNQNSFTNTFPPPFVILQYL
jgi:hypothetical protein